MMRRASLAATAIVLLTVVPVPGAHISFFSSEYNLPPDTTSVVHLVASGGETVRGLELALGIQNNGPTITALDLTSANLIFAGGDAPVIAPALPAREVYAGTGSTSDKTALGTLAIITLSTVGIAPGKYTFSLFVGTDASYFTDIAGDPLATTLDGAVLNVVPEPTVWIQLLGLIGVVPMLLLVRRKLGK